MAKHITFSLLVSLSLSLTYGQRVGYYYVPISMDSTQGWRLRFLNETTVELSSIPKHLSPSLKTVFKYISTDTTIEILPNSITNQDIEPTVIYARALTLETKLTLTKIERGFIDYNKSLIYVRQKDSGDNLDIVYIIDGNTYIQAIGATDDYGLKKKRPKKNKALQKKLKTIDKVNCSVEVVRGLAAYERFGIDRVYGAIVITSKK